MYSVSDSQLRDELLVMAKILHCGASSALWLSGLLSHCKYFKTKILSMSAALVVAMLHKSLVMFGREAE